MSWKRAKCFFHFVSFKTSPHNRHFIKGAGFECVIILFFLSIFMYAGSFRNKLTPKQFNFCYFRRFNFEYRMSEWF